MKASKQICKSSYLLAVGDGSKDSPFLKSAFRSIISAFNGVIKLFAA